MAAGNFIAHLVFLWISFFHILDKIYKITQM